MEFDTSFYGVASTSSRSFGQSTATAEMCSFGHDDQIGCGYEDEDMRSYDGYNTESESYASHPESEGGEGATSGDEGSLDGLVLESEPEPSSIASSSEISDDGEDTEEDKLNKTAIQAGTEMLRLRFPSLSLSIRLVDFCCLQQHDLLNDTIIDFYLNHIVEHLMPDEEQSPRVTVLPSVFWHNLSLKQSMQMDDAGRMSEEAKQDVRFSEVLEFLDDFELIDADYILCPINEWQHWSLAVVCHPSAQQGACMVLLDSRQIEDANDLSSSAALLDEFLAYAFVKRTGLRRPTERLPWVVPEDLAQQANDFDSGIFVLEYARRFLLAPPQKVHQGFNFAREYSDFTTVGKRKEIQKVILSLCTNRKLWAPLLDLIDREK